MIGAKLDTEIVELPSTSNDTAAYAVFEDGQLARAVILYSKCYLGEGERKQDVLSLRGMPAGAQVQVKRFNIPTSNATGGW